MSVFEGNGTEVWMAWVFLIGSDKCYARSGAGFVQIVGLGDCYLSDTLSQCLDSVFNFRYHAAGYGSVVAQCPECFGCYVAYDVVGVVRVGFHYAGLFESIDQLDVEVRRESGGNGLSHCVGVSVQHMSLSVVCQRSYYRRYSGIEQHLQRLGAYAVDVAHPSEVSLWGRPAFV